MSETDPLATLRSDLDGLEATPVAAQADVFERINATLAAELAELDEV